jgi:heme A synthase
VGPAQARAGPATGMVQRGDGACFPPGQFPLPALPPANSLPAGLIRQRELERHPFLSARDPGDVPFAGRVFDKLDVPRPHGDLFSSRNFKFSLAAERDHILAPRAAMPVGNPAGRPAMKLGPGDLPHIEGVIRAPGCELHFYLFGMGLIVRTRKEPGHEHGLVRLGLRAGRRNGHVPNHCANHERERERQHSTSHFLCLPASQYSRRRSRRVFQAHPARYSRTVSTVAMPVVKRPWLHRFTILLATGTLLLFVTGGFVTSNEERPFYSFGQLHTMVAGAVGILTAGLVIWLWLEKEWAGLRRLGWMVLATLAVEAVLGMQADSQSPAVRAFHAFLAQLFFSITIVFALFTSRGWKGDAQPAGDRGRLSLSSLATGTLALMGVQVAFGVALRHGLIGVALHILGAFVVVLLVLTLAALVARRHPEDTELRSAANAAATFTSVQAFVGFTILSMQGSRLIDPVAMIVTAAIHTAVGALALAATVVMALLMRRNLRAASDPWDRR